MVDILYANSPDDLKTLFNKLLKQKNSSASAESFIRYVQENDETLIRIKWDQEPVQFFCWNWRYGRPRPDVVDIFQTVIGEQHGEKPPLIHDEGKIRRRKEQEYFLSGGPWVTSSEPLLTSFEDAMNILAQRKIEKPLSQTARPHFFRPSTTPLSQESGQESELKRPPPSSLKKP